MKSEFLIAITQMAAERHLPKEVVMQAVEAALVSAYKKETKEGTEVVVRISSVTGDIHAYELRTVVETVETPLTQVSVADARKYKKDAKVGDVIEIEMHTVNAARIAAQTVKQVIMQRLREAEREQVYEEYVGKAGDIVSGIVQRIEGRNTIVDLGRAEALMPPQEQVPSERYRVGQRMKFYVLEVNRTLKGPQVVISRTHKNLIRRLFELEVPEVFNGIVEIKAIAREPGFRSKVAVWARQEGVDPVGSCVGLRGIRIQNVVNELHGEKIDVILWNDNIITLIANALSPAQVVSVAADEADKSAIVVVPDRQLSLAIGKEGQNARLGAKLTGWRIDIKSHTEFDASKSSVPVQTIYPARPAPAFVAAAPIAQAAAPAPVTATPVPVGAPEAPAPQVLRPAAQAAPAPQAPAPAVPVAAGGRPQTTEEGVALTEALSRADLWSVSKGAPQPGQIRFADDILPHRGGVPKAKGKKGKARIREELEEEGAQP